MKRSLFLLFIVVTGTAVWAQSTITLTFTGRNQNNAYVRLDNVTIQNLTRGWTEAIFFPDTVYTLTIGTGISDYAGENEMQVMPNPFDGRTQLNLCLAQGESVRMVIVDITGKKCAEYNGRLSEGDNIFEIMLTTPQTYILSVQTSEGTHSVKMVNTGRAGENRIMLMGGEGNMTKVSIKSTTSHIFELGDEMRYTGYSQQSNGLIPSTPVTQNQYESETITLHFTLENDAELPIVATVAASNIGMNTATTGGNVFSDGGAPVIARGVCYSVTPNPTLSESHTSDGTGTGAFTSNLTNLVENTTYYVRAYATNSAGTAYGQEVNFTTETGSSTGQSCPGTPTVTDYDGNVYHTVQIGTQCWTRENMRTTHYSNGDPIAEGIAYSSDIPYRYAPDGNAANVTSYGYLYNWPAVMHGDSSSNANPSGIQGICPAGWHVPSAAEWDQLATYVNSQSEFLCGGYNNYIAKALASNIGWNYYYVSNACAVCNNLTLNNATGFSAMPAGESYGTYHYGFGDMAAFSTSTLEDDDEIEMRGFCYDDPDLTQYLCDADGDLEEGYSVRCVRGEVNSGEQLPKVVTIGVFDIGTNSVLGVGNVVNSGTATVINRGFCYSTTPHPTIADYHTNDGSGPGAFVSNPTSLAEATMYYYRAYVTSSLGTTYGSEGSFITTNSNDGQPCAGMPTLTDYDGNIYNTVQIGNQCWMKENLRTTHYANGDVCNTPSGNYFDEQAPWRFTPNDDATNVADYGYLYNLPAILHGSVGSTAIPSGVRGICPTGWHMPSLGEFQLLSGYLSSRSMYLCNNSSMNTAKSLADSIGWDSDPYSYDVCSIGHNPLQNNSSGFSARPAGDRSGYFAQKACFWTISTSQNYYYETLNANYLGLYYYSTSITTSSSNNSSYNDNDAFSVRCVRDEINTAAMPPTVTTDSVVIISDVVASLAGTAISANGATVLEHGFCWSTSSNPTLADSHRASGDGLGSFSAVVGEFTHSITYYLRAYATNSAGTGYGNELTFTMPPADNNGQPCVGMPTVTDHEGNVYNTVQIGNQCWMKENMRCTTSPKGILGNGNSRYYNDTTSIIPLEKRGLLYNWQGAMDTALSTVNTYIPVYNTRGICPEGWHIPSSTEWTTLQNYVNSQSEYQCSNINNYIAKAMAYPYYWKDYDNNCAVGNSPVNNNATGFSIIPAGTYASSSISGSGNYAYFWSRTTAVHATANPSLQISFYYAKYFSLTYSNATVNDDGELNMYLGCSVRCLCDETVSDLSDTASHPCIVSATHPAQTSNTYQGNGHNGADHGLETLNAEGKIISVTDYDGNEYPVVQIGSQCWLAENLRCSHSPSTGTNIVNNLFTSGSTIDYTYTGKMARWYNNNATTYSAKKYGLLYNWNAAVDTFNTSYGELSINTENSNALSVTFSGNRQGICPVGWHVPSDEEWSTMEAVVSGSTWQDSYVTSFGYRGTHAGSLAGSSQWHTSSTSGAPGDYNNVERNSSCFRALPAGYYNNGAFTNDSYSASFWSSKHYTSGSTGADERLLYYNYTGVFRCGTDESWGNSVRCLRDEIVNSTTQIPTVTTTSPTNVTATSATLNGSIFNPSSLQITPWGFEWKVSTDSVYTVVHATGSSMSRNLYNLTANTSYTYRAFITYEDSIIYGNDVSFMTLEAITPIVTTTVPSYITATTATLHANISNPDYVTIPFRGFEWKVSTDTNYTTSYLNITGDSMILNLTGLTANTQYTYRAFVIIADSTIYSIENSFTTLETPVEPMVTTSSVFGITHNSATLNGTVSNPDNVTITAQGFEWKISNTTSYTQVSAVGTTMIYNLTGLTPNTSYTYHAFVATANGTSYGNEEIFTTPSTPATTSIPCDILYAHPAQTGSAFLGTGYNGANHGLEILNAEGKIISVTDYDGNEYPVVQIGSQCWLAENMRCTHSPTTGTYIVNNHFTTGDEIAYSYSGKIARWYNNDSLTYVPMHYGLLYNWNAAIDLFHTTYGELSINSSSSQSVSQSFSGNRQGICPRGWHVPSDEEWTTMETFVNGSEVSGTTTGYRGSHAGKLSTSDDWMTSSTPDSPGDYNNSQRNSSGFGALPVGRSTSSFDYVGTCAYFWSTSNNASSNAYFRNIVHYNAGVYRHWYNKSACLSVRCIRDESDTSVTFPTVATLAATSVTGNIAKLNGTISNPATLIIAERGFEWKATNSSSYTQLVGSGSGNSITANLTNLADNTSYSYRAYLMYNDSIIYGNEMTFTTFTPTSIISNPCTVPNSHPAQTGNAYHGNGFNGANYGLETVVNGKINSVTDYDGNVYPVVQIGSQCWLAENMRCTHSPKTGTYIVNNLFSGASSCIDYTNSGKMARWYNNDSVTYAPRHHGLLYNWNAAVDIYNTFYGELSINTNGGIDVLFSGNRQGICPKGWHIPSDAEWTTMETIVNGSIVSGNTTGYRGSHAGKLVTGDDWTSATTSNTPGDYSNGLRNSSGFAAFPAGYYSIYFNKSGNDACFWSSTRDEDYSNRAFYRDITYNNTGVDRYSRIKYYGYSVRCLRDEDGNGSSAALPTVVTNSATSISMNSAILNGSITNPENITITSKGFEWKRSTDPDYSSLNVLNDTLTFGLTNLVEGSSYLYRAWITYNGTTYYGNTISFRTATAPTVTTNFITPVSDTSVTLNGTISNPSNVPLTTVGFEWKISGSDSYSQLVVTDYENNLTANLTGLNPSETYTYRAFITYNGNTVYGVERMFNTLTTNTIILELTFDPNCFTTGGWSQHPDNQSWQYQSYNGSGYIYHQPVNGTCDDWVISPEITINEADCFLKIEHRITDVTNPDYYQVYYSTTYQGGDINLSDWQLYNLTTYPSSFANSNALTPVPQGTFRIGIRYNKNNTMVPSHPWIVKALNFYRTL